MNPAIGVKHCCGAYGWGLLKKQPTKKHGRNVIMDIYGSLRGSEVIDISLYSLTVAIASALTVAILGETCAIPNDDTLVGKVDEKVNERHSPQTGTHPGIPGLPGLPGHPGLGLSVTSPDRTGPRFTTH